MLGVYRGLMLFADDMANLWVRPRNALTPISAMALRGTDGTIEVRHYVDAIRQAR